MESARARLASSCALYAAGASWAIKSLGQKLQISVALLRNAVTPRVWLRSWAAMTTPQALTVSGRWVLGAGLVGAVVAGGPAIQAHTQSEDTAHEWRLRAKASLAQAPVVAATPAASVNSTARIRRVAEARHIDYAPQNANAWAPFQHTTPQLFDDAVRQQREHECLSRAIYYEARAEPGVGQYAVAEVVLNRVRNRHYPNTICEVVYEGSHRATGCQFTFTCDGSERRAPRGRAWDRAQSIAVLSLLGLAQPVTGKATHYHADYVNPYWAPTLVHTETIGAHIFYKMPSRG